MRAQIFGSYSAVRVALTEEFKALCSTIFYALVSTGGNSLSPLAALKENKVIS